MGEIQENWIQLPNVWIASTLSTIFQLKTVSKQDVEGSGWWTSRERQFTQRWKNKIFGKCLLGQAEIMGQREES